MATSRVVRPACACCGPLAGHLIIRRQAGPLPVLVRLPNSCASLGARHRKRCWFRFLQLAESSHRAPEYDEVKKLRDGLADVEVLLVEAP